MDASRATALAVVLISCTPTHSNLATAHAHSLPPPGTAPTQTGPLSTTISPRSPSTASSSASHATRHVPAGFGQRHITLACDDSAGDLPVGESGSNVMIAGAQLTGLTGGWDPSLTSEVGLVLPADEVLAYQQRSAAKTSRALDDLMQDSAEFYTTTASADDAADTR